MNLETFSVDAAMVHDIPRGNDASEELLLTDEPIRLDTELRAYFRHKIVISLRERGVEAIADNSADETVRAAIAELLNAPAALALSSRTIAERLHGVQTGRNPPGLLAVILGTVDGKPTTAILKLEREHGLRFHIQTVAGRRVVDLQLLRDLTLTNKTKVFKTALLTADGSAPATASMVKGRVSDDQRGTATVTAVASFFLGTFLGCRLRDNPEKVTLAFAQAVDGFINQYVVSAERKGRYQVALLATMQNQTGQIQARRFAHDHIDPPDRPELLERVRAVGLDPDLAFVKDTSLVRITGFKMTFNSGMVLVGTQHDLQAHVRIRPDNVDTPGVDIDDTIKRLQGR